MEERVVGLFDYIGQSFNIMIVFLIYAVFVVFTLAVLDKFVNQRYKNGTYVAGVLVLSALMEYGAYKLLLWV